MMMVLRAISVAFLCWWRGAEAEAGKKDLGSAAASAPGVGARLEGDLWKDESNNDGKRE